MESKGPLAPSDSWTDRYEALRAQVLGGPAGTAGGRGAVLFMRAGSVAWMRAWAECSRPLNARRRPGFDVLPAVAGRDELIGVLASMAMANAVQGEA